MAFIPILLIGCGFFALTTLLGGETSPPTPEPKTPEQKLADAIAEYLKSVDQSDSD